MQNLDEFWALTKDVWQTGVFGVDIGALVSALAIFVAFLLLRGLITRFIIGAMRFKVSKTRTSWTMTCSPLWKSRSDWRP